MKERKKQRRRKARKRESISNDARKRDAPAELNGKFDTRKRKRKRKTVENIAGCVFSVSDFYCSEAKTFS